MKSKGEGSQEPRLSWFSDVLQWCKVVNSLGCLPGEKFKGSQIRRRDESVLDFEDESENSKLKQN